MLYSTFQNEKLSALGFGAMRLPLRPDGGIDQAELDRMVDAALAAGVNYFDTAYAYHGGRTRRLAAALSARALEPGRQVPRAPERRGRETHAAGGGLRGSAQKMRRGLF